MIKSVNILLLVCLCFGACQQQSGTRPPRLKPARINLEVLLKELQQGFAANYLQALQEAEPPGRALTETLTTAEKLHHRPVLVAAYTPAPNMRFATLRGLTPAGELLQSRIAAVAEHGLDPETFHASRIARLRHEQRQLAADVARINPPAPPRLAELAPLKDRIKDLAHQQPGSPTTPVMGQLISWLVSAKSPIPRIATAFEQARKARRTLVQTMTHLELTLADGLLHYALVQGRGNLKPMELRARHYQDKLKMSAVATPEASSTRDHAPAPKQPEKHTAPAEDSLSPLEIFLQKGPQAYIQSRLLADFKVAQGLQQLRRLLDLLPPRPPQYARLVLARRRYRALEEAGGWATLTPTTRLRRGRRHPSVPALKRRLALEGFFKGDSTEHFGGDLARAVEAFQETHQLQRAGRLRAKFWRALNVPVAQRRQSIELTLQRWRESGIGRSSYYMLINIPDFHLEVWKAGKRLARHKVVVGRNRGEKCDEETERKVLAYATPVQSALLKTLIFCPYWNVTRSIKETELDPERGKDPLYYPKHGFEVMKPGTRGEWVRELPGPANSLGFVKFIFPNPHETYVHDTPNKGLFRRPVRAFSHGCMRVQSPWDLAKLLLTEDRQWDERTYQYLLSRWRQMDFRSLTKKWDPDLYDYMVEQAQDLERRVELASWVDVFVEYYTVRVDDSGRVHFLTDLYDLDQHRRKPRAARPCIPESKRARRGFRSVPRRLAAFEQTAALLASQVLLASALIHTIKPRTSPGIRRLIKKMGEVSKFNQYHQSLTQSIKQAHEELDRALKKRGYRWNDRLQEQAIRIERLITSLDILSRKARAISDQVIKRARRQHPGNR